MCSLFIIRTKLEVILPANSEEKHRDMSMGVYNRKKMSEVSVLGQRVN